jgi:hypothetical protein
MNKDIYYVEPNQNGRFSVTRKGAKRASFTEPTQTKAIQTANNKLEDAVLHVARVNQLNGRPHPDKFRKIHI